MIVGDGIQKGKNIGFFKLYFLGFNQQTKI